MSSTSDSMTSLPNNILLFYQATGARAYERFTGMQIAKIIQEEPLGLCHGMSSPYWVLKICFASKTQGDSGMRLKKKH